MSVGLTGKNRPARSEGPLRVALRVYDWSEWCRHVIRGVQRFAHERPDWQLLVAVGPPGTTRILRKGMQWDGIITHVLKDVKGYKRVMRGGHTKIVSFSASIPRPLRDLPSVRVDDMEVARSIGRHFLAGGFRRFAYGGALTSTQEDLRLAAMTAFAESENCPLEVYRPRAGRPTHRSLVRWAAKLSKPIGIVTWNMDEARHVVEACLEAGVAIPEQAAVVAWDDDVMAAEGLSPTISAVDLPAERLGYESARMLDGLLSGDSPPAQPLLVEPSGILRVRQSSDVSTLQDRDVYLALQYIREHAAEGMKVDALVKVLRVSRRKLEQHFLRVTGRTLHDAIIAVRLDRAKQLLIETDWGMDRIAERCGMSTKKTLRRLFAEREGMTPTDYRGRFGAT